MNVPSLSADASMADVVAVLREVGARLPPGDGFRHFNAVYLLVTEGVAARVAAGGAHDVEFLIRLDVIFCQLYLDALRAADADEAPRAWQPMLRRRRERGISGLRFAVAGMNAHINRDLPVALDRTCRLVGGVIHDDDARHRDFRAVDEVLGALMPRSKDEVQEPLQELFDDALGTLDDVLQHWSIKHARRLAWENGQFLHRLRDQPSTYDGYLRGVDSTAGVIGRLLLI